MIPLLLTRDLVAVLLGGLFLTGMYLACRFPVFSRRNRCAVLLVAAGLLACSPLYTFMWNVRHPIKHELAHDSVGIRFYYSPVKGVRQFGLLSYLRYQNRFVATAARATCPLPNPDPSKQQRTLEQRPYNVIMIQVV